MADQTLSLVSDLREDDDDEVQSVRDAPRHIPNPAGGKGRSKITIEYIQDEKVRHRVFHRRKAGLLKKLKELHILTGSDMMLIVKACNGSVVSFATGDCENKVAGIVKKLTSSEEA